MAQWRESRTPVKRPVHGDFYDKQVIISAGRSRLIDLDAARMDDPLLDLGNYIAHLKRQAGNHVMAASDIDKQIETLISSYQLLTGSICTKQLGNYTALGLFNLTHQPFRDWVKDWPEQTEQLLEQVEDCFAI